MNATAHWHHAGRLERPIGPLRKLRYRGRALVEWIFTFTTAVYDLVRIRNLVRAGACP